MQTLTAPTIFPCYAAADRALAERLAALLERGADVRVFLDEGQMPEGGDLAEKAREARMADIVIVLFSRNSMPSRWPRALWEDALVKEPEAEGVRIAFLKCDDCIPPRVLTPMFDAARLRDVKRWVRGSEPGEPPAVEFSADLEVLGIAIADRPGAETVQSIALAREFARAFAGDFDAVLHLDCTTGTLADMAGDLAWQVGLHLEGELADNLEHLRVFCAARRLLVVLDRRRPRRPDLRRTLFHADLDRTRRTILGRVAPTGARLRCRGRLERGLPSGAPGAPCGARSIPPGRMLRDHDPVAGHGRRTRRSLRSGRSQPRTRLDSGWLGPHCGSPPVGADPRHGV